MNTNIIIDTDVGTDDLMAMAYLLNKPEVEIEAITIANGLAHVEYGARNVLKMLSLAEKEIPVYMGNPVPLMGNREFPKEWRRSSDLMPGIESENIIYDVQDVNAVDYLLNRLQAKNKPVRILALGPLTNLAIVYQSAPESFDVVEEIVLMGGAFKVPGNVFDVGDFISPSDSVEWNIFVDPIAAKIVCESGVDLFFVPLDATDKVPIDRDFLDRFNNADVNIMGKFVARMLNSFRDMIFDGGYYAWDPLAAVALVTPEVVTVMDYPIQIVTSGPHAGRTVISEQDQFPARIAVDADREIFETEYIQSLTNK